MPYYDWVTAFRLKLNRRLPPAPQTSYELERAAMLEEHRAYESGRKKAQAERHASLPSLFRRLAMALRLRSARPQKPT